MPTIDTFKSFIKSPEGSLAGIAGLQTILGIWTALMQGGAEQKTAEANARIAEINRQIAEIQAQDALVRGQELASIRRQQGQKTIGRQKAALAAQGIRIDAGSAADVQQEAADFTELDVLAIRKNALREAFGYRSQGYGYGLQSSAYRLSGEQARAQSIFDASQTLLTGGMKALGYYREWSK